MVTLSNVTYSQSIDELFNTVSETENVEKVKFK